MLLVLILFSITTSGVIELTQKSFNKLIKEKKTFLVTFYAKWGQHCQKFLKIFSNLTTEAEKYKIVLGKVDVDKNQQLADKYYVAAYPTIKMIGIFGEFTFDGNRTFEGVHSFMLKKSGNLVTPVILEDVPELKNQTFIISYFPTTTSSNFSDYRHASVDKNINFYYTKDLSTFEAINSTQTSNSYLYRHSDGRTVPFSDEKFWTLSTLKEFIDDNIFPSVLKLSANNANDVLKMTKKLVVVFTIGNISDKHFEMMDQVVEDFFERIQIVIADIESSASKGLVDFFEPSVFPSVWGLNPKSQMMKYKAENNAIGRKNFLNFLRRFDANKLERFFKTQPLPENWDKFPVKVLTSENLWEVALDENKSVFVFFYAPWCGHSKRFFPVWTDLALYYKHNPNILFTKIDGTKNECEIEITAFPTLLFFPRGPKTYDSYKEYEGSREFAQVKTFLSNFEEDGPSVEL